MNNHKNYNFLAYDWFKKVLFSTNSLAKLLSEIPLTNRVRGPYRKLRTEFFPPRFMAQARSVRAINRRGKNEDPQLTVRTEKTRLVRYLLYL